MQGKEKKFDSTRQTNSNMDQVQFLKTYCTILNFFAAFQIEYVTEPSQLEFLRLLSDRARQRIKYNCKDSVAWGDKNNGFSMSLKIKADNGVEMHAGSSNKFKPKLILDDCSVSKVCFLLLRRRSYVKKNKIS